MNPMQPSSMTTQLPEADVLNLSRRRLLGAAATGLALGLAMPRAFAQSAAAPKIGALLTIRPDSSVHFRSVFNEGGQGVFTAVAQMIGEELDIDPSRFVVSGASSGSQYHLPGARAFTGGSNSVRSSYQAMRKLGALARQMLIQAAATRLGVPATELSTEPGRVIHAASGRSVPYGEVAAAAAALPVPADAPLRDKSTFRWIGKPVPRLDVRDKSTGKATYAIDLKVDDMLLGAVQHAPRLGMEPGAVANEAAVKAMPGVHSVHRLPGAVAVLANSWWRARKAVEALQVTWSEAPAGKPSAVPADFSSAGHRAKLRSMPGNGASGETVGDAAAAMAGAKTILEATYEVPHLAHAQLEPPSAIARFNADGTLEVWAPNQAPDMFQADAANIADLPSERVTVHSPMLGGFFGRHFLYASANPYPQAILLAKAAGRPVKLIWSREEEFLRDALRPTYVTRFRAGLDTDGTPRALEAVVIGEGVIGRWFGRRPGAADRSAVEGIAGKAYAIANRRIGHLHVTDPAVIGFWRSVGHSMNDFFYESFFDEMADAGKQDPYQLRLKLLADKPRHKALLEAVGSLSGGWKRGPYSAADGTRRARGVAMASPFGSEVATIAEVSMRGNDVVVHDIWVAIDPGSIVNPAIIEAQVRSAVALGLSSTLLEEVVYEKGMPSARNFDAYPILTPDRMPKVHVRIVESGAPMGGIGEPGLPGVPPAVANAVAVLVGRRPRSLPLANFRVT
ncbi:MAG: molybdopterin-dependent oxidoreductase [Proteobacteria bacterium]|nr:molybdopterin-dependent oxidoreductase [Pseudomonadota bacterium]